MKSEDKTRERTKGIVALIFLSAVFASMGLFVRYLSLSFTLYQQVYLRLFAAICIGFFIFNKQLHLSVLKQLKLKDWAILMLRAITMYVIGVILFSKAILLTKYSNVSFISALPITALYGFFLLHEQITWQKISLIGIAFIGVLFLSVSDFSHIFEWGVGEVAAFVSVISFSLSYVARKWQTHKLNNQEITLIMFIIAFLIVFTLSLLAKEPLPLDNWTGFLLLVVITAGLFNVINLFLTNYGFQHVKAVLASNLLTFESVFAVTLGFLFYQEIPSIKELIGGVLIMASVIRMNRLENKKT